MWTALDPRRPGAAHALLILAATLALAGAVPPFDQDEAAYAGFAHRMVATGDLRLPDWPLSEIHRKPPLAFWSIAGAYALLGESWATLRLPGALCFLATLLALARGGAPLYGAARARTAAVLLGTSAAALLGRLALTDAPLLLATTVAALSLHRLVAGHGARHAVLLGLSVAAALLTKGPAVAVFLAGALPPLLLHPGRRHLLLAVPALALAPLPLLAWGAAAWPVDDGATVRWMLDWYLLRRAGGATLGQAGPPGAYALSFLLLLLPWAGLLPAGLARLAGPLRRREPLALCLGGWLLGGWLLWELLPSKLPAYAAGGWPALALVAAGVLHESGPHRRLLVGGLLAQGVVVLALAVAVAAVGGPAIALGAAILLLVGLALWRRSPAPLVLVAPALLVGAWALVLPRLEERLHPTWTVARTALARIPPGTPVVLEPAWRLPSLPYHFAAAGHPVRLAAEGEAPRPGALWITAAELAGPACRDRVEGYVPDKGQRTTWHLAWIPGEGADAAACPGWPGGSR